MFCPAKKYQQLGYLFLRISTSRNNLFGYIPMYTNLDHTDWYELTIVYVGYI
jgi:hypothetical protein